MDWFEFLVGVLQALVWPVVVVAALLLFHEPIRRLIPRIQGVELAGFKATLAAAKEAAEAGPRPFEMPNWALLKEGGTPPLPRLELPAPTLPELEVVCCVAEHPLVTMQHAWAQVVEEARKCAQRLAGESVPKDRSLMEALVIIQKHALVPVELYAVVFRLEVLEAEAREADEATISGTEAVEYWQLAERARVAFARGRPA